VIPLLLVHNPRARRYLVRLRPDGCARVTIPRGGRVSEARRFAEWNQGWLEGQLQHLAAHPLRPMQWRLGTEILFRGERVKIEADVNGENRRIRFGNEVVKVAYPSADLRAAVERISVLKKKLAN